MNLSHVNLIQKNLEGQKKIFFLKENYMLDVFPNPVCMGVNIKSTVLPSWFSPFLGMKGQIIGTVTTLFQHCHTIKMTSHL